MLKPSIFFLSFKKEASLNKMAKKTKRRKNTIAVLFCTREEVGAKDDFMTHLSDTCGCDGGEITIYCMRNSDGAPLARLYADMVDSDQIDAEIIVFIHDDIEFLKEGWGKEIIRLFKENKDYGIIGVAGSAQFDSNAAWWNYDKKYGQVLHRQDGKSWLSTFSPLLDKDLEEVAVIDGLFMAVNRSRISKNFSRELEGFDMYDIDFCLANFVDKKCKIGVTTNIRIAHNSIGRLKDTWYKNRDIINKKYERYYPIDIKKKEEKRHED